MTTVLAIDPGASGGIATFSERGAWAAPLADTDLEIIAQVEAALDATGATGRCVIERVHAMPGGGDRRMGATSAFTFGRSYGFLRACLLHTGLPFEDVAPQTWQKSLGLGKLAGSERKRALKALAQQRFPGVKVTLRTADALLLAEWGWLKWSAGAKEAAAS